MVDTSPSLLLRLQGPGDADAWRRFVSLYTPLLFAWARRQRLQPDDAADLVQEVLALLVRKLPQFHYDGRRSFRGWLRAVTLNKLRELHRKRVAVPVGGGAADELAGLAAADDAPFWEAEYRAHLSRRALQLMQREFSPSTWKACWATTVEGRPADAVAAELGLTPGAVRSAKLRVLVRLRQELAGLTE